MGAPREQPRDVGVPQIPHVLRGKLVDCAAGSPELAVPGEKRLEALVDLAQGKVMPGRDGEVRATLVYETMEPALIRARPDLIWAARGKHGE